MGGKGANLTAEQGIISMKYVIDTIGFGRDLKYHAMFYDSDGKIFDY